MRRILRTDRGSLRFIRACDTCVLVIAQTGTVRTARLTFLARLLSLILVDVFVPLPSSHLRLAVTRRLSPPAVNLPLGVSLVLRCVTHVVAVHVISNLLLMLPLIMLFLHSRNTLQLGLVHCQLLRRLGLSPIRRPSGLR